MSGSSSTGSESTGGPPADIPPSKRVRRQGEDTGNTSEDKAISRAGCHETPALASVRIEDKE